MDAQSLSRLLLGQLEKKKRLNKRRQQQQQTSDDDDDDDFFLGKYPKRDKRTSRKKRQHEIRQLMKQAKILISRLGDDNPPNNVIGGGKKSRTTMSLVVLLLKQKKTPENPLKNELANPSGLDFANQMGALITQPTQINMVPPGDETRRAVQPEKIASGVKSETKKVLEPRSNIYDINMQGRKSFTFACQGTFHHLRLYGAIIHFSVKLVTAPVAGAGGGAGYQQYHIPAHTDEEAADSLYGPVIVPNRFANFFFKKATIELDGGIEIEPTNQTHQITKLIRFHMNMTPENAEAKYSTLGGYVKDYDSTLSTQKYQVPVAPDADGIMQPIAGGGNDYKTIQRDKFLEGTAGQPNAGFRYMTKGAAALSDKFNNGAEVHFQVPLHRICHIVRCEQMLPSNKDYYITLHRMKESFLLTCQDAAVHQNLIFQITNCEIHVPIVELMPEKRQEE